MSKRMVYALIPARGGSKGVKNKNLKLLAGKPLIEYTISAALKSAGIDEVFVSSDCTKILDYASGRTCNIVVRPAEYSQDWSSAVDVVRHFISTLSDDLHVIDPLIIYLQPTSPLRNEIDIDAAITLLKREGATRLISVVEMQQSPYKAFQLSQSGVLQSLFDESYTNKRRQDLPKVLLPNGAIYTFLLSEFIRHQGFPSNGSIPFIMEADVSIDVDNENDFNTLEQFLEDKK
jgi:CMP-N,N'-diacetyllegionaminic acid synthase